jgi:hypothetical protein
MFIYNYAYIMTKKGLCTASNLVSPFDLFDMNVTTDELFYVQHHDAFDLITDRDSERYDFIDNMPFHTRHKDLGVEMHLFEGKYFPGFYNYGDIYKFENLGFLLTVHSPDELPDHTHNYYTVSPKQSYLVLITPQLKTIDDSLITLSPEE